MTSMYAMVGKSSSRSRRAILTIMVISIMMSHVIVEARYHYHKNPKHGIIVPYPPPPLSEEDGDDQAPPQPSPEIVPSDPSPSAPPPLSDAEQGPPSSEVAPSPLPDAEQGPPASEVAPSAPPPLSDDEQGPPSSEVAPSDAAGAEFDVMDFGAAGDGEGDDTGAFREAWKAACAVEGGVVVVPEGRCFMITSTIFSGPCKPGLVFQLDGVLMPPDGPHQWPDSDSRKQWLVFYKLADITLSGHGTIQGNGDKWWEMPCKPHRGPNGSTLSGPCDSPVLVRFFMSSKVTVRGISIKDSPQFHMKFNGCEDVVIERIRISSPKLSPNTDGIHIQDTTGVGIYDSLIANGDDCISIGSGCRDVDIRGVTCGPSHGISIGSLGVQNSQACVSNVTVRDCTIRESDNGLRIKTWQGGSGSVTGILFDGILMDNVRNCINVDQFYCLSKACLNQTSAVHVTDIAYRRIKGTYDARETPIHFACSDALPCTNITMSDVELLPHEGHLLHDPFCWNAFGALQSLTIPPVSCLQEGQPLALLQNSLQTCL